MGSIFRNWQSDNPFLSAWSVSNLLSYDVQVKIWNYQPGANAVGISFRLDENGPNGYGVSFCEPGNKLPSAFDMPTSTDAYVVLWQQTNGTLTRIAYSKLTSASGVVDTSGHIKPYSTLLLSLKERFVSGTNGARQNLISVYVQGTSTYPRNTSPPKWQTDAGSQFYQITWTNGAQTITNSAYTSADFSTRQPAELGLHTFSGNSSPKSYFDDFWVNFGPSGGSGSGFGVVSPIVY